jgi:site-specific recombinase XerD
MKENENTIEPLAAEFEIRLVNPENVAKKYSKLGKVPNSKTRFTKSIVVNRVDDLKLEPKLDPVTARILALGKARGFAYKTIEMYISQNINFLADIKKTEDQVCEEDITTYVGNLPILDNSKVLWLCGLKFYYVEVLKKHPIFENIKFPKKNNPLPEWGIDVLHMYQLEKYFNSIDNKVTKLMLEFLYSIGARIDEFCKLKWENIDLTTGIGIIKGSRMGGGGKGNKERSFEILYNRESILERLKNYRELGIGGMGKYHIFDIDSNGVRYIMKEYGKRAGFPEIHPHTLRHSFATHFYMRTKDLVDLQHRLGHTDINMTTKYVTLAKMVANQYPGNLLDSK